MIIFPQSAASYICRIVLHTLEETIDKLHELCVAHVIILHSEVNLTITLNYLYDRLTNMYIILILGVLS